MKKTIKKIKKIISNDIFKMNMFFLIGIIIFSVTNFFINKYFGSYTISFLFIAYSIFMYKTSKERSNKN